MPPFEMMRSLFALLLSFLIAVPVCGSTNYSVSDGLSNSSVKAIYQDSIGYMWFGTKNGLNRFDGYEFRTYHYRQEGERQKNDIVSIQADRRGRMWIGSFNGITLFNPYTGTFVDLRSQYTGELPVGVVVGIWISGDDEIWVATKRGLFRFGKERCEPVERFRNLYINSMSHCGGSDIILDVIGEGLLLYDTESGEVRPISEYGGDVRRDPVNCCLYDGDATTWLFVEAGHVLRYDLHTGKTRKVQVKIPEKRWSGNNQVHAVIKLNRDSLLLAADAGVMVFNTRDSIVTCYSEHNPRGDLREPDAQGRIMSIFRDRDGSLWIGTFEDGISFYNPRLYSIGLIRLRDDGTDNPVRVISDLVEVNRKLIVGYRRGISIVDLSDGRISDLDLTRLIHKEGAESELFHLAGLSDGTILIYILNVGIFSFDPDRQTLVQVYEGISSTSQIRTIEEDAEGNLWFAADELCRVDRRSGAISRDLSTNYNGYTRYMLTQDICREKNGDMLVGTRNNGLWRYPCQRGSTPVYFETERVDPSIPDDANISKIAVDGQGRIWIGTYDSGLYMYDSRKRKTCLFNEENGLRHNTVYGIAEDGDGRVWVSTLKGLSFIDAERLSVVSYTQANGYPLRENSNQAILMASDGNMYVGGNGGLAVFSPRELTSYREHSPRVFVSTIESLKGVDDRDRATYDSPEQLLRVRFRHANTSIRIKISTLNYLFQSAYRYAYRVEDVDDDWNYTDRNDLILSNLPYGRHLLKIKASDEYGNWSDVVTKQVFVIVPPFWLCTGARIFYGFLSLTLLFFIFKYLNDRRASKYKRLIDQLEKENIEKAYKLRIDLFTQFSHELRTPLTLITAPTEDLLRDESLPEKFVYPIRQIDKNANRILLLVNQLLDFRKIENGNMKLRLTKIDCRQFLTEELENFRTAADKRGIGLDLEEGYLPDDFWADADLLDRVVANLLSNAIKHSPDNARIEIGTCCSEEGLLRIYVQDYGEGIDEIDQEKIFEPFYQVPTPRRLRSFGSGIGLTLVKYVTTLHKGRVWVESRKGEGSRFVLEFPLGYVHYQPDELLYPVPDIDLRETIQPISRKEEIQPVPAEDPKLIEEVEKKESPVLLIVEDDEELRNYIRRKFEKNYRILEAADGVEAFELARAHIPDLILSDVMMPNMNGVELCRRIKEELTTAHIPVILLTAKSEKEQIEEGYQALADDYVLKPFSSKILRVKIESLIANRARLRELLSASLKQTDSVTAETKSEDPFFRKLVELIKSRVEITDLSVNDLYPEMGISRAQFFRKVKAISNLSPNRLIVSIKMNIAADMLREGRLTVSEVAYKLGYTDPSYFSKVFKGTYGISPSDYLHKNA